MDILNPEIIKIGKRFYRKNPTNLSFSKKFQQDEEEIDYNKQQRYADEYEDESCGLDQNGKQISCKIKPRDEYDNIEDEFRQGKNGQFELDVSIAPAYYGFIIGRNGEQKKRIEIDTKTTIVIPARNAPENALVIIKGESKQNINSCKTRLELIVSTSRQKLQFSHFIAFPVNFEGFQKSLADFKAKVLEKCSRDRGVHESIFQNPFKLHLTIATLVLMNQREKEEAINILEKCKSEFINSLVGSKPLKIHLKGIEYMNDDPSAVDVLYAEVKPHMDNSDLLQEISDKVVKKYRDADLIKKDFEKVKLHATIMNTLRRANDNFEESNEDSSKGRQSFDARNILKHFKDFDFGTYVVRELQISIRFSTGTDGYFDCLGKITL